MRSPGKCQERREVLRLSPGGVLQCSAAGEAVGRASEVKSNQERVGSWKPRGESSRKGVVISYVKMLLREQVIK